MHRPTLAALALTCATTVNAFTGTYPILAWSDAKLDALSLLSTPASASASTTQQTYSPEDDLCSLSSLLVVSIPGLHYSDLARLPTASDSPNGIHAAVDHAETRASQPYVRQHTLSRPLKLVRRFEKECGAVFESQLEKTLWTGPERDEQVKTIRIVQVDGLEEWELSGGAAADGRKRVLETADQAVAYHLANLASPHAVIVTALPTTYSSPRKLNTKQPNLHLNNNLKRQLLEPDLLDSDNIPEDEQEFIAEVLDEIKEEQAFDNMMDRVENNNKDDDGVDKGQEKSDIRVSEIMTPESLEQDEEEWNGETINVSPSFGSHSIVDYDTFAKDDKKKHKDNQTSIFEPAEKSGLLHRYVFFTPALVFSLLVTLMVLVPTVLIAVKALTSIETVHGLETKMTGSVGIDPSKA
ncbi:Ac45/VOA1 transmembrane domain-containing protein [Sporobolomyces koalae]|uniref:Ac45/VOA1 transmembrane domain-containing protein n=1 Tax=Sporobolomyces koalae TaxID=500713 RepID=UPI003179F03D